METNKILTANILDIIFDGRNKQYGAYELRTTYNSRMKKSLLLTALFFMVVFLTSVFASKRNKNVKDNIDVIETSLAEIKKKEVLPSLPPPVKVIPPLPRNQMIFTPPVIVKADQVQPDEVIREITDDVEISNKTVVSENVNGVVNAPQEPPNSNVIEAPKADPNEIFTSVQQEAEFPGGNAAWARFLERSLNGFNPSDNGAAPGRYSVMVRFVVSKDGTISDVQAETSFGYGMEEKAVKCIRKGPNWKPALQNGTNVNAYRRQPIVFVVNE
jgi:periplasmic protein TonB